MSEISAWARMYGLPDPMVTAATIVEADADLVGATEVRLTTAATLLRATDLALTATRAVLAAAWSAATAVDLLDSVTASCRRLADDCSGAAAAARTLALAIETAHAEVATSVHAAESTIAARGLSGVPIDPEEMARIGRERCALVMGLHAAMTAIARRLDDAAAAATLATDIDLRRHLPPGMTPPARPAAHDVDSRHRAEAARDLTGTDPRHAALAGHILRTLQRIEDQGYAAQLITYSPDDPPGQGAVAIAIGDVATADIVSVVVPGIGNSPAAIGIDSATDLARASAAAAPEGATSATVLWYGYDIPLSWPADPASAPNPASALAHAWADSAHALDATRASVAGPRLGSFTGQLRDMMSPAASLTLIGHSYGSVVVSQAAKVLDRDAGIDDIVLLASPGAGYGIESAADYRAVGADHVYTLAYPGDPIAQPITDALALAVNPLGSLTRTAVGAGRSGPFGVDPNAEAFGGQRLTADSPVPISPGIGLEQHALSTYLAGEGLTAVAEITAGRYGSIEVRRPG